MIEQHLYNGDSAEVLKQLKDNSVDFLCTDPPYSIGFMGKEWDKALPSTDIWKECYRALKPGSFIAVMSSPRSDVLYRMIQDLEGVGFDMSFSPIYFTFHTGFPKASDTSKILDKRGSDLSKKYEGSKLGFQPKPTIEHIIIAMKPHGSKSYIDNVLNFEALPESVKMTYPFIQVPKPSKKEKSLGTDKVIHPTIKPIKLFSYLITLFTREGDWVIDPFLGSGTCGLSSKLLNRNFLGVEMDKEYFDICEERLSVSREELINFFKDK
jgi:site-specific DNA-methyltransferase (adenine-specific)